MTATKYAVSTPGPWRAKHIGNSADGELYDVYGNDGSESAVAEYIRPCDAWLIAAAPTMYDALDSLALMAEAMDMHDMAKIARDAMNAATRAS